MTVLRYKDYQGAVAYEDGVLIIRVLHIEDSISTECDSASAVQTSFEDLIEDYLETCEAVGKEPNKPFKGSLNIRITPELHKRAAYIASAEGKTLNSWIGQAIEHEIEQGLSHTQIEAKAILGRIISNPRPISGSGYKSNDVSIFRPSIRARAFSDEQDVGALVEGAPSFKNEYRGH